MNCYKMMAITFAFALLVAPALAEFRGKQGEKATYESLMNGQIIGTAIYNVEGKFKFDETGKIQGRKFVINDSTGGKVEWYLDDNGKPMWVDVFDQNSTQPVLSVDYDYQKRIATVNYTTSSMFASATTQTAPQTRVINITQNTYDAVSLYQSLRYMPIKEGYKASFQVLAAEALPMIDMVAPLLAIGGVSADMSSMITSNVTLQVAGRESIRVGNSTYDCYKVIMNSTTNTPPQLAAFNPSMSSQSMEQQVWLRTNDLLLVRSYSESTSNMPQLTGTTTPQRMISETRLVSVTYA